MTLPAQLTHLEAAGLIRLAAASPELAYIFQHALTRDAAYTSLLRRQRRAVHRAAGEVLETLFTTTAQRASAAPMLAEHWAQAGEPARALDYWELAADQALAQYALPEAIAHLAQALDLAPQVPALPLVRWAALYCKRGRAQYSNTEWQASWDTHTALLALGEQHQDDTLRLAALLELANQRAIMNPLMDQVQARLLSAQALDLARRLGDRAAEAKALWITMRAHSMDDQATVPALAAGEQSLALARAEGLAEQAAYTLSDLQYAYRAAGQDERALAVLLEARAYWRTQPGHHMLADNLNQIAVVALALGDYALAEEAAQEALALSQPTHNRAQQTLSMISLAQIHLDQGRYGLTRDLLIAFTPFEQGWFAIPALSHRAQLLEALGQTSEAITYIQAAVAPEVTNPFLRMFRHGQLSYLAYLQAHAGQLAEAEGTLQAAQALPPFHERFRFANNGYYWPLAQAALAAARRDWPTAHQAYAALGSRLATTGPRHALAETFWRHGEMLAAQDAPEAEAVLTQAVETADAYGQRRVAWRAWHTLAAWQAAHGQPAAAIDSLARARAHLTIIVDSLPDAATRAPFLNLPDVQAVLHSAP